MNLGWKLAATLQNRAPINLLASYEAERHPIGAQILDWSLAQVSAMRPTPQGRAVNSILRELMDTRDGSTYFAAKVWGILTHYNMPGTHPLVGYSAPNFEFGSGLTVADLLHECRCLLIDFQQRQSLQTFASSYPELMYHAAGAKEELGIRAALMRPDGIVVLACDGEPDIAELKAVAALWFAS